GGLCSKSTDGREQLREASLRLIEEIIALRDAEKIERAIQAYVDAKTGRPLKKNWPSDALYEEVKDSQDAFKKFLQDYLTPPRDPELEKQSAELTRDAVVCFRAVYEQYRAAKASRNALDFADLILLTLQMLRNQPEVCERIARGIDHLLIDEFQDTDMEQYEIARLLCGTTKPPELFIVGDAKQSIYRFRGAEVEVFEKAREPRRTIGLYRNFRTVPEILEFVNALFARSGLLEAVEPEYVNAEAHRAPVNECRVRFLIPERAEEKELANEARTREAAMIGDWIAAACSGALDVQIQPKGTDEKRPMTFGDIAMLFRALSDVHIYERALSERNIPFHVIAGKGFYERQEVLDVRNLLEAVVDPWHEPALLGFLRSPMVALDDDSLLAICRGPGATAALLEGKTPMDFAQTAELDHARAIFRDLRSKRAHPLPDFVRYLLECTGYEAMLAGLFLGEQRVCNVRKVMQLAEAFAKTRRPRLSAFVRYLDDIATEGIEEGEAALQAEGSDEVTLMSIHKSKGLEFPAVVLPDLSRDANAKWPSKIVFHRHMGMVARPYDPGKKTVPEPQIYEVIKRDERAKEEAERARLLYVAATRARDWLVLGGSAGSSGSGKPPADSLLAPFANEFGILGVKDGTQIRDEGWSAEVRRVTATTKVKPPETQKSEAPDWNEIMPRLDEAPVIPATEHAFAVTTLAHHMYLSDEEPEGQSAREPSVLDPLRKGTLVHRYFEVWDFQDSPPDIDRFLRREMPAMHLREPLREELKNAARRFKDSEAWDVVSNARNIQREAPFILRIGDALVEGVIDALLDDSTILDYKTGLRRKSRMAMYEAQLCLYAEALYRLRGVRPERAYLYYVDTGDLDEADISHDRVTEVVAHATETIKTFRAEPLSSKMETYIQ
ncbi:MAG: UvrD-helicase domain-containing protein, partial [Candidatus Hydrogenedentota bacterium]